MNRTTDYPNEWHPANPPDGADALMASYWKDPSNQAEWKFHHPPGWTCKHDRTVGDRCAGCGRPREVVDGRQESVAGLPQESDH